MRVKRDCYFEHQLSTIQPMDSAPGGYFQVQLDNTEDTDAVGMVVWLLLWCLQQHSHHGLLDLCRRDFWWWVVDFQILALSGDFLSAARLLSSARLTLRSRKCPLGSPPRSWAKIFLTTAQSFHSLVTENLAI